MRNAETSRYVGRSGSLRISRSNASTAEAHFTSSDGAITHMAGTDVTTGSGCTLAIAEVDTSLHSRLPVGQQPCSTPAAPQS